MSYWAKEAVRTFQVPSGAKFLLYVLAYRVNVQGVCWPSQRTLCEELNVSESTLRRRIRTLERLGLVETSIRYRNGVKQANQYRLTKVLEQAKTLESEKGHQSNWKGLPVKLEQVTSQPRPIEYKGNRKRNDSEAGVPAQDNPEDVEVSELEERVPRSIEEGQTVADTLQLLAVETTDEQLLEQVKYKTGVPTTASLVRLWKNGMAKYRPGRVLELTGKQNGQLKLFGMRLGANAPAVLLEVLKDWSGFASLAEKQSGQKAPQAPRIDYLLVAAEYAQRFWELEDEEVKKTVAFVTPQIGGDPNSKQVAAGQDDCLTNAKPGKQNLTNAHDEQKEGGLKAKQAALLKALEEDGDGDT